jgi:hypothetical protein
VLDQKYVGLDLLEGKVAIVAALVLLIGLMALRGARSRRSEKIIATVMILAGVAGTVFPAALLLSSAHRLSQTPEDDVRLGVGIFLCVAGGIIAVLGGILDLAWATAPEGDDDPDAPEP